jgi:hypothetical protein
MDPHVSLYYPLLLHPFSSLTTGKNTTSCQRRSRWVPAGRSGLCARRRRLPLSRHRRWQGIARGGGQHGVSKEWDPDRVKLHLERGGHAGDPRQGGHAPAAARQGGCALRLRRCRTGRSRPRSSPQGVEGDRHPNAAVLTACCAPASMRLIRPAATAAAWPGRTGKSRRRELGGREDGGRGGWRRENVSAWACPHWLGWRARVSSEGERCGDGHGGRTGGRNALAEEKRKIESNRYCA